VNTGLNSNQTVPKRWRLGSLAGGSAPASGFFALRRGTNHCPRIQGRPNRMYRKVRFNLKALGKDEGQ